MSKGGRPSKYDTMVLPRFAEIEKWLSLGATDKEIAENLGINKATIIDYKKRFPEFSELIKNGRLKPIQDIKASLYRKAVGFNYQESEETTDSDGNWRKRVMTKYCPPDPASAMILLKHWDKDTEWTNDPATLRLRKEELDIRKKELESNKW